MDTEDEVMDVSEIQEAATIEDDDVESIGAHGMWH